MLCHAASYPADSTVQQQLSTDGFQACSGWELSRTQKNKQSSAIHTRCARCTRLVCVLGTSGHWPCALFARYSCMPTVVIVSSYNIYYVPSLGSSCEQDNIWLIGAKTLKGFRQNNGTNLHGYNALLTCPGSRSSLPAVFCTARVSRTGWQHRA